MVRKSEVTTLSIYIPKNKLDKKPIERLDKLAEIVDRSINYLVVEAILQYLDREEKKRR
ncbi:CopG family ribbon-helix-helix protein [Candidatus Bipolaricaulota bacterium]